MRNLVRSLLAGCALALALAFALWVWPTSFRYVGTYNSGLVRIHRLTGQADLLTDHGWQQLRRARNPADSLAEEIGIARP